MLWSSCSPSSTTTRMKEEEQEERTRGKSRRKAHGCVIKRVIERVMLFKARILKRKNRSNVI
ncbi:hypothetical protein Scep_024786 [Stephania cephalantha]|uniref:Uncharacterized protein n=1 Tax=Stephania cephalantha TaxID=152367 RepID=A0AAP0HYK8_9MAGN